MAKQVRFPRLFPELEQQPTPADRRRYVRDELLRMAEEKSLWLTAIMVQRNEAKQYAGDVIFGHGISDGKDGSGMPPLRHVNNLPVPLELEDYEVTLEPIPPYEFVSYVDGKRQAEDIVVGSQTRHNIQQWEDNWIELPPGRAKLRLRKAWLALKRHGEHVVRAQLPEDKKILWRCREVHDQPAEKPRREREARA